MRNPLTGPAGHSLPAFGGPKVRLSRQRKLRLRVSGGERVILSCLRHHCAIAAFLGGEAGQDLMSWS
ncbi:hypothetical protein GAY31_02150 [Azospirillum brasilense]|nr:hypothetical protein [Azospirillum brasilense]